MNYERTFPYIKVEKPIILVTVAEIVPIHYRHILILFGAYLKL